MMLDEFEARHAAYTSVVYRRLLPAFLGGWTLSFPGAIFTIVGLLWLGYESLASPAGLLVMLSVPLWLWPLSRETHRLLSVHGVLCPCCGKSLYVYGHNPAKMRRCVKCGEKIIEDV